MCLSVEVFGISNGAQVLLYTARLISLSPMQSPGESGPDRYQNIAREIVVPRCTCVVGRACVVVRGGGRRRRRGGRLLLQCRLFAISVLGAAASGQRASDRLFVRRLFVTKFGH